jgi:hypothetical protein
MVQTADLPLPMPPVTPILRICSLEDVKEKVQKTKIQMPNKSQIANPNLQTIDWPLELIWNLIIEI